MVFDVNYIRSYMSELDDISGFDSSKVGISISKRLHSSYAYSKMKWDYPNRKTRKLINDKIVFSQSLLECGCSEESFKQVIRHEYCHAWVDDGQTRREKHSGVQFKKCCRILNCFSQSICTDDELNKIYNSYLRSSK